MMTITAKSCQMLPKDGKKLAKVGKKLTKVGKGWENVGKCCLFVFLSLCPNSKVAVTDDQG